MITMTVWTKQSRNIQDDHGKPKCIFVKRVQHLPKKGDTINIVFGGPCIVVTEVIFDYTNVDTELCEVHVDAIYNEELYGEPIDIIGLLKQMDEDIGLLKQMDEDKS